MRHFVPFFFLALFFAQIFRLPATAAMPPSPLLLRIGLSFDLKAHVMRAEARLLLPAGRGISLDCAGLDAVMVAVDGAPLPPAPIHVFAAASAEREIVFSYEVGAEKNPDRLIAPEGVTLMHGWHPMPDQPVHLALSARLPPGFTALSSLPPQETKQIKNGAIASFSIPPGLQPAAFVAGPYEKATAKIAGGPTVTAYFFPEDRGLAQTYADKAAAFIGRYAALFGPYPHEHFAVVANRLPSGYALPGLTLLGQSVLRLPFVADNSLAHEVLHAWFGIGVQPEDGDWAEGLVAHLADHALARERGEGFAQRRRILVNHESYVHGDNSMPLAAFRGAMDHLPAAKKIRAIGYGRGLFFFHMLEQKIGATPFRQGLRSFFAAHAGGQAGWNELRRAWEKASGQDLAAFFAQWLATVQIPELAVDNVTLREDDGQVLLSFQLRQKIAPFLRLDVPMAITTPAGVVHRIVSMENGVQTMEIPLDDRPLSLAVDPGYDLLRGLTDEELPPAFSTFLGGGDKALVLPPLAAPQPDPRLVAAFRERGIPTIDEKDVNEAVLRRASLLFTDPASATLTGLLGPMPPESGLLWMTFKKNPLAPRRVLGAVSATATADLPQLLARLFHYGDASTVVFGADGRARRETTATAGMVTTIEPEALAIPAAAALDFSVLAARLAAVRVAHVGETHTAMGDHRLQLAVIRAMHRQNPDIAIGMEMFPRASQQALDDYIAGRSDERLFLKKSGYFRHWGYDFRLYRDIFRFARRHKIAVIALNIEKDLIAKVFRQGAIGLETAEKSRLPAERDLDMPGYRERLAGVFRQHPGASKQTDFAGFLQSQALWDEGMAESAAAYLAAHPGRRMVIVAGRGHTDKENGIPARLARRLALSQLVLAATGGDRDFDSRSADYYLDTALVELSPLPLLGVFLEEAAAGKKGVQVGSVSDGAAAARAGLLAGDHIVSLDGETLTAVEDVKILMLEKEGRDSVALVFRREKDGVATEQAVVVSFKQQTPAPH